MVLPSQVRSVLYVLSAIVTPVLAYLADQSVIDTFWVGLWAVVNSAILVLARVNVSPDERG